MLTVENARVSYGKSSVINGISLTVSQGEKLAVLGRNGVGKTTLLKSFMGILPLKEGRMTFKGEDITRKKPYQRSQTGMAYVPQGREILPLLTVKENLEMGALGHKGVVLADRMAQVLEYFPVLKEHLSRNGGVLSGGQQQQLAIGRALMSSPKILLLDEPTEGIQPNIVAHIAEILNKIRVDMGITLVIVEQNLPFAKRIADTFVVLQKGQVVASGATGELSEDVVRAYLTV